MENFIILKSKNKYKVLIHFSSVQSSSPLIVKQFIKTKTYEWLNTNKIKKDDLETT